MNQVHNVTVPYSALQTQNIDIQHIIDILSQQKYSTLKFLEQRYGLKISV